MCFFQYACYVVESKVHEVLQGVPKVLAVTRTAETNANGIGAEIGLHTSVGLCVLPTMPMFQNFLVLGCRERNVP